MTQLRTKAGDVLINSRELIERLVEMGILGELNFRAIEAVTDLVLTMDCELPWHAAREESLVALEDGVREGCPSSRHDGALRVVEDLDEPLKAVGPEPVVVHREPEGLLGGAGDEGREHLAGPNVEGGRCGHRASGGEQAQPKCATDAARDGRAITLVVLQRCGMDALGDVTLEAELAREMTLGDLTFLVDLRAKWKRDAILELSRRLQEAAKQF